MSSRIVGFLIVIIFSTPQVAIADEIDCGFYNEIEITDPAGDATPGAPPYVDILGLEIRQFGDLVQFEWFSDGNPQNSDFMYFFVFLDTDFDLSTGQNWGGKVGAEIKIGVSDQVGIDRFNAAGDWISQESGPPVNFTDTGFTFNIEAGELQSDHFNLYFEASGAQVWADQGSIHEIQLSPAMAPVRLVVRSDQTVPIERPHLISIPSKDQGIQLSAWLEQGAVATPVSSADVAYSTYHPRAEWGSVAEDIIPIDSQGVAHYLSEGFVFGSASLEACNLTSDEFIIATGDVFRHSELDRVVAVFPSDWTPPGANHSFGYMMSTYPNYIHLVNQAYLALSELYRGFQPFDGDTQIFSPVVEDGLCGGHDNPLHTSPECYMVGGDGSPQYHVVVHEMGHNFSLQSKAMNVLLQADNSRIAASAFVESVASLPVEYFEWEVTQNGARYGIQPGSFEEQYYQWSINFYCPDSRGLLEEFEGWVAGGQVEGIFDTANIPNPVGVLCSLFQAFSCDYIGGPNPHRHHMIRRFLNVFNDEEIPGFQEEKVDTYFGAAYSAAAGRDMRAKLKFWGFEIDDDFYNQIMPMIESRIELFSDRFEFGNANKWSTVRQ